MEDFLDPNAANLQNVEAMVKELWGEVENGVLTTMALGNTAKFELTMHSTLPVGSGPSLTPVIARGLVKAMKATDLDVQIRVRSAEELAEILRQLTDLAILGGVAQEIAVCFSAMLEDPDAQVSSAANQAIDDAFG